MDVNSIKDTGTLSGSGAFSSVYVMPDGSATKVCNRAHCDAWLLWAAFCLHNPDLEHLPTIHGIVVDVDNNRVIADMELLHDDVEGLDCDVTKWEACDALGDIWAEFLRFLRGSGTGPDLSDAVRTDCAPNHNIMVSADGDTGFLTDPVVFSGFMDMDSPAEGLLIEMVDFLQSIGGHPAITVLPFTRPDDAPTVVPEVVVVPA